MLRRREVPSIFKGLRTGSIKNDQFLWSFHEIKANFTFTGCAKKHPFSIIPTPNSLKSSHGLSSGYCNYYCYHSECEVVDRFNEFLINCGFNNSTLLNKVLIF